MEIAKVRDAFDNGNPIDWIRVHRLPDTVRFVHSAHIKALSKPGMPTAQVCSTCHGDIPNAKTVGQVRSLKMGDCVACHRQNSAPTDCTTCHK
ncbi:MAG: cytochrome c3 [Dehalococcoidia bacterium]|nr:cytochrome c3 [Dehalococcoidia bacterium]